MKVILFDRVLYKSNGNSFDQFKFKMNSRNRKVYEVSF